MLNVMLKGLLQGRRGKLPIETELAVTNLGDRTMGQAPIPQNLPRGSMPGIAHK